MDVIEELLKIIRSLVKPDILVHRNSHLRDELGLNSLSLMHLTVLIHKQFNIDIGRRAVELNKFPNTIEDIAALII